MVVYSRLLSERRGPVAALLGTDVLDAAPAEVVPTSATTASSAPRRSGIVPVWARHHPLRVLMSCAPQSRRVAVPGSPKAIDAPEASLRSVLGARVGQVRV